jgi:hypothetical protein
MASGIRHLLDDGPFRGRLAAAGRDVALDRHDVARLISRVEALYAAVVAGKAATTNGSRSHI